MTDTSLRPACALRVGITGTRNLQATEVPRLQRQLADILGVLRDTATAAVADPAAGVLYAAPHAALRLLSPLARGADRLAAAAALDAGYALHVPMPFSQPEYEQDFTGTDAPGMAPLTAAGDLAEFRALLARAATPPLALDGTRGETQDAGYEAVGRLVTRNSDVLIAIWDGAAARGRGGTADILRFATRFGTPVWWIHATRDVPPVFVTAPRQLQQEAAPAGEAAVVALRHHVTDLLHPPPPPPAHAHGLIGLAVRHLRIRQHIARSPIQQFLHERPLPNWRLWKAHAWFLSWAAGPQPSAEPEPPPVAPPPQTRAVHEYWKSLYDPPDARANDYARRYRSAYVLVFALAAVAAVGAAVGLAFHQLGLPMALLEAVMLAGIFALVATNQERNWHERWIGYRLLAELCRKQQMLAQLGWSLPTAEVARLAAGPRGAAQRRAWIGWYFNAAMRAAPLPSGKLDAAAVACLRQAVSGCLVRGQAAYHEQRGRISHAAAKRLGAFRRGAVPGHAGGDRWQAGAARARRPARTGVDLRPAGGGAAGRFRRLRRHPRLCRT